MKKIKILINCHKQTERLHDDIFTPILAGSAFADASLKEAFADDFHDDMGDNIARLHPYSAELTAIYWAWKNYDRLGDPDYIGLFHYRRFFNFSFRLPETDNWKCAFFDFDKATRDRFGWDREHIEAMCDGAELILPDLEQITDPRDWQTPCDLETHFKRQHVPESLDRAAELIREKYPDYAGAVDAALRSYTGHFCNLFIMKRELFFDYAQWLFGIILPLEKLLPVSDPKYDNPEQRRVLGFLGERLFNIWITEKTAEGVTIRETQRLTGYLTDADRSYFRSTYGAETYRRCLEASKLEAAERRNAFDVLRDDNVVCRPIRSKKTPLVSVLIPVYNVSAFLRECCESLINQTMRDIEFVFVNDASTDNSMEILEEYYERDERVVIVEHRQNRGLPGARNTALRFVRGKYFSCIDSDDVCDVTMFGKLYDKAEALGADIVTCSVFGFFEDIRDVYYHRPLEWFGDSDRLLPLSGRPQQLMEPAAWCKLFRTDYVRSLDYFEFRPGTRAWEDVPSMTNAFCRTDRIATVQEALYYYRQRRQGNITSNITRRYIEEFISGAQEQQQILDRLGYHDETVRSYIEEFKLIFAEWSFKKLRRKDVGFFLRRVPCLFKKEDEHYLQRVFDLYPNRKRFYKVMMTRSALIFCAARFGYHALVRVKRAAVRILGGAKRVIKKIFNIRREDVFWTFGYGALSVHCFNKRYYRQTIDRYNGALEYGAREKAELETALGGARERQAAAERALLDKENALKALEADKEALDGLAEAVKRENELLTALGAAFARSEEERKAQTETLRREKEALTAEKYALEKDRDALSAQTETLRAGNDALAAERGRLAGELTQREEELAREREQLDSYKKEFDGFYHAVWATGWIETWKKYYYENYDKIEERIERLTAGMDEESRETVRRHCFRNFELLPTQKNTELFLYCHDRLYTRSELEGAKTLGELERFRESWRIPESATMETSVWRFDCGLKMLPQHVLDRLRGRTFIDGGAYWGDSALMMTQYVPGRIYAFEPQPDTYQTLCGVLRDNGLDELAVPVRAGLGERGGTARLYTGSMISGANLFAVDPEIDGARQHIDEIDIVSIDEMFRDRDERVGLIKLDVEGSESAAVSGAMEIIRRDRPVLAVSVYHTPRDFFDIKPMLEKENLGYRFMVRKLVFHDLVTEVTLLAYTEEE